MITSLYDTELKKWFNIFAIIFLSLLTGFLIVYVNGVLAFGLFVSGMLLLYLKKIENIFLMWLLFHPIFNIDALAFLRMGGHPIITFDRVVIGAVLLFVLVEVAMKKRDLLSVNKLEIAMILFSAVMIFSIVSDSLEKISGAREFIDIFLYPFIIYFLAKNLISDEENFNKFINILLIIGVYLSLMGVFEYLTGRDILAFREGMAERSGWLRVNGPFKDDSAFGVAVSICFFIVLYKIVSWNSDGRMSNKPKVFFSLILGLSVLAIIFNFYRGIWIALIVGLLSWFLIRKKGFTKLTLFVFILAIIMIPIFNTLQSTRFFRERLTNIQTIQTRFNIFDEAVYLFKKNPIKGSGFNNFSRGGQHNTFLAFLSETGILGVSVFMLLVWFLYFYGFRNYKLSRGHITNEFSMIFLCILICYSVTWLGLNTGFSASINKLFYAITGVSLGLMQKLDNQDESDEKHYHFIKG